MRNHRVTILNKVQPSERQFGEKTGYRRDGSLWSSYEFSKGTRALREGALDAYDSVIFRMNFSANVTITRESLLSAMARCIRCSRSTATSARTKSSSLPQR